MENNEQIDNADDLKKLQDNLVNQELLNKISIINEFYKKFIDNEIDKNTESFSSWWNGDEDSKSFHQCKNDISNAITEGNKIPKLIEVETKNLKNLELDYLEKIKEIENIKRDLNKYRTEVVIGTVFKAFKSRSTSNSWFAGILSLFAIISLAGALGFMIYLANSTQNVDKFYPISTITLFITLSIFCSNKSKIYHKLAEEYGHKATILESFVGYGEEFKKSLGVEKYNSLFDKVTEAVSSNPSDKIDKLMQFKWPWEKAIDVGKKIADKVTNSGN
jgi:hypothetical protein